MKIKKGDNVVVIAGKDKGKTGTIEKSFPRLDRVVIEGVNVVTKHKKATRSGEKGQKVTLAMPIHVSNVMIVDPKTKKPARIGFDTTTDKKTRVYKVAKGTTSAKKVAPAKKAPAAKTVTKAKKS